MSTTNKKALILGAGYLGQRLISPLITQDYLVDTVTRSSKLDSKEIHQHFFCSAENDNLSTILKQSTPDLIVVCWAPGSRGGDPNDYRRTYWDRLIELRMALFQDHRPKHIVYISSTSVYGDQDGSLKSESDPPNSESEKSKYLIKAEREVLSWSEKYQLTAQVLRCSGIFGPDRQPGLRLLKRDQPLPGNGQAWVNLVHVDDIVQAILLATQSHESTTWNVNTISIKRDELYRNIAKLHGLTMQEWEVSDESNKIGRRIDAKLIKNELDWNPKYTSSI